MSKTPSRKLQTRNKLKEGENYTFKFWQVGEERCREESRKRVRLIQKYRHFALFEYPSGVRERFDYGTVRRMLDGEVIMR